MTSRWQRHLAEGPGWWHQSVYWWTIVYDHHMKIQKIKSNIRDEQIVAQEKAGYGAWSTNVCCESTECENFHTWIWHNPVDTLRFQLHNAHCTVTPLMTTLFSDLCQHDQLYTYRLKCPFQKILWVSESVTHSWNLSFVFLLRRLVLADWSLLCISIRYSDDMVS